MRFVVHRPYSGRASLLRPRTADENRRDVWSTCVAVRADGRRVRRRARDGGGVVLYWRNLNRNTRFLNFLKKEKKAEFHICFFIFETQVTFHRGPCLELKKSCFRLSARFGDVI